MNTTLGKYKIDSQKKTSEILREIETLFPQKQKLVDFDFVWSRHHPNKFGGIQLSTLNYEYKKVIRRVMVKDNELDLDEIKRKFDELLKIAIECEKRRKAESQKLMEKLSQLEEIKREAKEIVGKDETFYSIIGKFDGSYEIELRNLTKEQVLAILKQVKAWKSSSQ